MILLNWYKEWLELKREYKTKPCETCDTLRVQVEQLRLDNSKLMDRLLEKPVSEVVMRVPDNLTPIKPRHIPWALRRQMMESEDRKAAQLKRDVPKPLNVEQIKTPSTTTTEELEEELDNAERERTEQK